MFSCEFCEIYKNAFPDRTPPVAASVFHSSISQLFQFEHEQKKTCGNESHEKETKDIHTSAADL